MKLSNLKMPLALACSIQMAFVGPATANPSIRITVAGIKAPQGYMMIALHDEKGWSGAPIVRTRVSVTGVNFTLVLTAPTPGRYGLKLFQDVNGDGKMETNLVGFPVEPFGFSNDAPVRMGPPEFAEAAFDVSASGAAQTITLK